MTLPLSAAQAILFDLDGTLLDTAPDFVRVVNMQRAQHNLPPLTDDKIRAVVSNGARALIELSFGIAEGHPEFASHLQELLDLYLQNIAIETRLFPGMAALLDHLEQRNIPWGIVTNKPRRYTDPLLSQLGLDFRAAVTVCPDDVVNRKPHPEPLFKACATLGLAPEVCVYVGDHERDIESGQSAGMATVAASYGYIETPAKVHAWNADYIIDQADELIHLLKN
ncbi:MAG: phosphoglycolate phosphatase [Hahellaceae bacterium]|nr:phosphoglycolate phosphatase [Hahellaceae bacterium]